MPHVDDIIPAERRHLLDLPVYGHLGTIRPNDTVQVNPMWFEFDGEHVRFTHTNYRQKYRNLQHNPAMSLSILDPDDPFRYLEVAGRLVDVVLFDKTGTLTRGEHLLTGIAGRDHDMLLAQAAAVEAESERERPMKIWLARLDDTPFRYPVKLEASTGFGTIRGRLMKFEETMK